VAVVEFRLNKIDTDIRQKINEKAREGKIHAKNEISVNTDGREERGQNNKQKHQKPKEKFNLSKYTSKNSKITIEAVKIESIEIKAEKEHKGNSKDQYRGLFLDTRK
jgi:hypothetical protein